MCENKNFLSPEVGGKESALRYLRLAHGLSREALAGNVGLSAEEIRLLEEGSRWLPLDQVMKLADYFGVTCTALLWDDLDAVTDGIDAPVRRAEDSARTRDRQAYRKYIGGAGEFWVAEQQRRMLAGTPYENAVNPNYAFDESAHFDILSFTREGEPVCIEVKATAGGEDQPFFLTAAELRFAESCVYTGKRYELHRVSHVLEPGRRACRVYSAQEVLEQFERIPNAYMLCRKEVA